MNSTDFTCPISLHDIKRGVDAFASVWVSSLELRVAVFVIVLQCCVMIWATCLVREIARTATTVLCRLLVYGFEASGAPYIRTGGNAPTASELGRRHKTDGGPPPIPHPEDMQVGQAGS